jgi:protein-S-isoprenylcysteine O-methyltransferase Ste14
MSTTALASRRRPGAAPSLLVAAVPAAIGALLVLLGWISVSGAAAFDDQTSPLNLAVGGALLVFAGCGFYLWAFRRRIGRRFDALRAVHNEDRDD